MARVKFGDYIRQIDYLRAQEEYEDSDENPCNKLIDYERQCNQDEDFTFSEIQDAHAAFREKVCVAEFPGRHSPAYGVAYSTVCVLERLTSDFEDDDDKATLIGHEHVNTWLALLRARPGSAHLDLMSKFTGNSFKQYLEKCSDDRICSILVAMKIKFGYDPSEIEEEQTYASFLSGGINDFFSAMTEEQCQRPSLQGEVINLHMYYQQQLSTLSPTMAQYVDYILSGIQSQFPSKNIYQNYTDVEKMKLHITMMQEVVCTFEGDIQTIHCESMLSDILNSAVEQNLVKDLFSNFMTLITQYSKRKTQLEHGDNLYKVYKNDLFRKLVPANTNASEMFPTCIDMMTSLTADKDGLVKHKQEMLSEAIDCELFKVQNLTFERAKSLLQLFAQMVGAGRIHFAKSVRRYLKDQGGDKKFKTVFEWKNLTEETTLLLDTIGQLTCDDIEMSRDDYDEFMSIVSDIVEMILEFHRKGKLLDSLQTAQVRCVFNCIATDSPHKAEIADKASEEKYLLLKCTNADLLSDILDHVNKYLEPDTVTMERYTQSAIGNLLNAVVQSYNENSENVTEAQNTLFMAIFNKCCEGSSIEDRFYGQNDDDDSVPSIYFRIYRTELMLYLLVHAKKKTLVLCKPVIREILRWAKIASDEDHDDVLSVSMNMLSLLSIGLSDDLSDLAPAVVDLFLSTDSVSDIIHLTVSLYPLNPTIYHERLQEFLDKMVDADENDAMSIGTIVERISAKYPQAYTEDQVGCILDITKRSEPSRQTFYYNILRQVATQCPQTLCPHIDKLLDDSFSSADTMIFKVMILGCLANHEQTYTNRIIDYFVAHLAENNPMILQQILNQILLLAEKNREYLENYKDKIESVGTTAKSPDIQNTCRNIVNVIEGKSIEGVFEDIQQAQDDIAGLDYKVGKTMTTVVSLGEHVLEQDKEVEKVKKDIEDLDEKVENVEEDLGVTKIKVEDIDNKTISSAPKWSKDLTRLLNPESEHDWRLLAKRLGYSNDDIKAWAQQHDPCMSMINEWYATHKTSEATHGLMKNLQEMERLDGVAIVENAMKVVEGVIEDEEFEYPSPPPIFLSYQWGVQNEVKLLKQHLNMAGYECWMDIGQMGGGDSLFQKIDNGVRAAKVIICCTTEKYAKSPNCNREVNLSVNLGKPIIPLLMEKMAWPPKGSMGPIFSEYLFIRFFQRPGEETKDQSYWPVPKFQELLMQLNFFAAPDQSLLHSDYDKWWLPIQEDIKIQNKTETSKPSTTNPENKTQTDENTSPELFLSYQWGRQIQVKALYDRLVGLGYNVWMDIFQMGGGDSLYDKIDRGIRGCKVVIACVTPKYVLSANCRREISLADAIKKPIIPLLLEEMRWPPVGPMSMVFTEVIYINMYRDPKVQISWTGNKFDELLSKVEQYFPTDTKIPAGREETESSCQNLGSAHNSSKTKSDGITSSGSQGTNNTNSDGNSKGNSSDKTKINREAGNGSKTQADEGTSPKKPHKDKAVVTKAPMVTKSKARDGEQKKSKSCALL